MSFEKYSKLIGIVDNYYKNVSREKIIDTINLLIEKEYLQSLGFQRIVKILFYIYFQF